MDKNVMSVIMVSWLYRKEDSPCIKRPCSDSSKNICSRLSVLGMIWAWTPVASTAVFSFAYKQSHVHFSTSTAPHGRHFQGLLYKTLSKMPCPEILCPKCVFSGWLTHTGSMCLCVKGRVFPCGP